MRQLTILLAATLMASEATAQTQDSVHNLGTLVVTAERTSAAIRMSTSAVSLLTSRELRRLPVRTLAEALQQVPGIAFIDFDGLGVDPQIMVRGFYGGGETESVVLLRDGRPLNVLESGRVDWDLIPLSAMGSLEVVRGGASAAWGDAALGGVIHVRSPSWSDSGLRGAISGGEYGVLRASARVSRLLSDRPFYVMGNYARQEGFRDHAERTSGGFTASYALSHSPSRSLALVTEHDWRDSDQPGPLTGIALATSRTQVSPLYRFDHADDRWHRITLEHEAGETAARSSSAYLSAEYRETDRIRTVPLTPDFADTKNRLLNTARLLGSAQFELPGLFGRDSWLIGFDGSVGRARSRYYDFLQGPRAAYLAPSSPPERGALDQRGESMRATLAGFFHYAWEPTAALRVTLGGRLDWLRDSFDARAPSQPADHTADHLAFSPKAGVNLRLLEDATHHSRAYVNVARSFKAPTLDQLFDQRTIPVPFPPFELTFANAGLKPQYATSVEAGVFHATNLAPELSVEFTVSAYHMSLRDELDFDLQTLSYKNIGRSRHRGVETGLRLQGPLALTGFANYTLQAATSRTGENDGNYLKAIPLHFITAGMGAGRDTGPAASLIVSSAQRIYLDDTNTQELPGWTRWDARLSWRIRTFQLFADVFNLFDAEYSTTGFPDAADPNVIYYYPAAGRVLQLGIRREW